MKVRLLKAILDTVDNDAEVTIAFGESEEELEERTDALNALIFNPKNSDKQEVILIKD